MEMGVIEMGVLEMSAAGAAREAGMSLTLDDIKAALEESRRRRIDPYRTHLQFLIGVMGVDVAVIVGVLAALPKAGEGSAFNVTIGGGGASATGAAASGVSSAALGGVLAWIAISALAAMIASFIVQVARGLRAQSDRNQSPPPVVNPWMVGALWLVAILPMVPGAAAIAYCVRVGATLLNGASALQSLRDALHALL